MMLAVILSLSLKLPREHTNRYGILDVESDDGRLAKARGLVENQIQLTPRQRYQLLGVTSCSQAYFAHLDKKQAWRWW